MIESNDKQTSIKGGSNVMLLFGLFLCSTYEDLHKVGSAHSLCYT